MSSLRKKNSIRNPFVCLFIVVMGLFSLIHLLMFAQNTFAAGGFCFSGTCYFNWNNKGFSTIDRRDSDGDKISNNVDACPKSSAPGSSQGCPTPTIGRFLIYNENASPGPREAWEVSAVFSTSNTANYNHQLYYEIGDPSIHSDDKSRYSIAINERSIDSSKIDSKGTEMFPKQSAGKKTYTLRINGPGILEQIREVFALTCEGNIYSNPTCDSDLDGVLNPDDGCNFSDGVPQNDGCRLPPSDIVKNLSTYVSYKLDGTWRFANKDSTIFYNQGSERTFQIGFDVEGINWKYHLGPIRVTGPAGFTCPRGCIISTPNNAQWSKRDLGLKTEYMGYVDFIDDQYASLVGKTSTFTLDFRSKLDKRTLFTKQVQIQIINIQ